MRKDLLTDTMQPKKDLVRIVVDKERMFLLIQAARSRAAALMFP